MALVLNAATPGRVEARTSEHVRVSIQRIERRIQQVEQDLAQSSYRTWHNYHSKTDEDIKAVRNQMERTLRMLREYRENFHEEYRRAVEREQARAQRGR